MGRSEKIFYHRTKVYHNSHREIPLTIQSSVTLKSALTKTLLEPNHLLSPRYIQDINDHLSNKCDGNETFYKYIISFNYFSKLLFISFFHSLVDGAQRPILLLAQLWLS